MTRGAWLERMNHALATRNYDGTFFHLRNDKVETLRIVHRVEDGKVAERLVSLDGSGREIIRNDEELTCYLPDQRRAAGRIADREWLIASGDAADFRCRADGSLPGGETFWHPARLLGRPTQWSLPSIP